MKTISLYFTLFVLLSNLNCGQATTTEKVSPENKFAEIKFQNEKFDLGIIEGNINANHDFAFSNAGNIPLRISEAKGNCHCVQAKWSEKSIEPGDSSVISVSFNPEGVTGLFQRTVMVQSNATRPAVELTISGEIKVDPKKKITSSKQNGH